MAGGESRMRRGRAGREESGGQRQTGGERKGKQKQEAARRQRLHLLLYSHVRTLTFPLR